MSIIQSSIVHQEMCRLLNFWILEGCLFERIVYSRNDANLNKIQIGILTLVGQQQQATEISQFFNILVFSKRISLFFSHAQKFIVDQNYSTTNVIKTNCIPRGFFFSIINS